jgi:hypothetical protein
MPLESPQCQSTSCQAKNPVVMIHPFYEIEDVKRLFCLGPSGRVDFLGVCIYHLPCLNLTARAMKLARFSASDHWLLFALSGLTLSIAVASTSYVLIERPILQWVKRRQSGR